MQMQSENLNISIHNIYSYKAVQSHFNLSSEEWL